MNEGFDIIIIICCDVKNHKEVVRESHHAYIFVHKKRHSNGSQSDNIQRNKHHVCNNILRNFHWK